MLTTEMRFDPDMESLASMSPGLTPYPPTSDVPRIRLRDMALPRKTTNALLNAGLTTVGDLLDLTPEEIARIPNVGAKSVNDIERALRPLDVSLNDRSVRPPARTSRCTHPRLDPEFSLRNLDVPVAVIRRLELAGLGCACLVEALTQSELLRVMEFDTVLTGALASELHRRRSGIRPLGSPSGAAVDEVPAGMTGLESELWSLTSPLVDPRHRRIALEVYGWDGGERLTLTQVAERHHLEVAAISSMCARIEARWKTENARMPRLREAIALLVARSPVLASAVETELVAQGLTARRIPVEGLLAAAAIGAVDAPLTIVGSESRLILPRGREATFNCVVQVIRRAVRSSTPLSPEDICVLAQQNGATGCDVDFVSKVRQVMAALGETTPGILSRS